MICFVTGANGFIGSRLCHALAVSGNDVVGLCRKAPDNEWLDHSRIRCAIGDVLDRDSLERGMDGCGCCFHLAGFAKPWSRKREIFFRVNVIGTKNVLDVAQRCGVSRLVHTSTAGVLGPSSGSTWIDETTVPAAPLRTDYVRTKIQAEQAVQQAAMNGLDACIVNPTRVFGPGPLTNANSLSLIMSQVASGKWRWIPGNGRSIGNYVFIDDVVSGHLRAMERGERGRRYVLGGENLSCNELFRLIRQHSARQDVLLHVPKYVLLAISWWQLALANCVGTAPAITPAFVQRYFDDWCVSSDRAKSELGYEPKSVEDGVRATMTWIADREANLR